MSEDPLALSKISAAPPAETDYESICAAVMETERGRWFLTEYARRNRHADTNVILSAIGRIEAAIRGEEVSPESSHLRLDLIDMAEIIARTEAEMAAIKPEAARAGNRDQAAQRQDSTAAEVLAAAERVLDIVWTLREREVDSELCDALQAAASEIHAAGERQDFTALRAHKAMQVLRHLEGRIHALIDVRGEGRAPVKTTANGAAPEEHETVAMEEATAGRTEAEPEVREPLGLDLDSLMPAKPSREAEADVEMAASPPVEEANLIDEAAALIGAASETADVSEQTADRPAEPDPAPAMLDSPADLATMDAVAHEPAEPLNVVADPSIIFAAARPPVFVVFQASETDEAPLDAPDAPLTELPTETDIEAAGTPEVPLHEPEPAAETVEDLDAADATTDAAELPIELPVEPISDFTPELEPEQVPSEADQATAEVTAEAAAEAAVDAVVEAVAEAMAEAATEAETASTITEIETAYLAPAGEEAVVASRAELEIEPEPSEPLTQALIDLESPPAVDVMPAIEDAPIEDAPIEELPEAPAATLPVEHRAAPAADIAAEPAIEVALIETHAPAEADDLIAQTADNSDVPPPAAASEPAAVDDLEFLLEPLSSQVAPGPDVVAPEPEIVTSVPEEAIPAPEVAASAPEPVAAAEPAAPTRGPAALLPEPDEDPADLFEIMPEPSEVDAAIPPPSLTIAPAANASNEVSVDAAIAESTAAISEAVFATPPVASVMATAQAETPPDVAAVAAPVGVPPPRLAPRQIQTPRVTPNDPMAAVRALSDDELIALFS